MDYKSHGNDCFWWIDKAEELLISSTILEEAYRSGLAKVKNSERGVLPNECKKPISTLTPKRAPFSVNSLIRLTFGAGIQYRKQKTHGERRLKELRAFSQYGRGAKKS